MENTNLRVRFAPAPTGMMHLGNVRTALMNYLLAEQKNGTFILRVEDTDKDRNFDPGAVKIMEDLAWLGITFSEGPNVGGDYGPYFQSERDNFYQEKLQELIKNNHAYRCFCTNEELDKKRQRQIALKQPPRYDRACLKLSPEESDKKAESTPYIWRVKLDHDKKITIKDLSHGTVTFDLKHFSDFPVTRQNGSVTFMFANFVDDVMMKMNCVVRGEDHLSNTAGQAALYDMFNETLPTFWHMPILCTIEGKKLSKRDFGFSLRDLKDAGFIAPAIINYLAIIGSSYKKEIMTKDELVQTLDFDNPPKTTQIKYDVDKLRWVNHKWLCHMQTSEVAALCRPYLEKSYPSVTSMNDASLTELIGHIQKELVTLQDSVQLLAFYLDKPLYEADIARTLVPAEKFEALCSLVQNLLDAPNAESLLADLKTTIKEHDISTKSAFSFVRYALTGRAQGIGVGELVEMLGLEKTKERIAQLLGLFS